MLFQRVDTSEWDRVYGQTQARLGRIDSGLAAVDQAVAKARSAGITPGQTLPALPTEKVDDTGVEGNGAALADSLLARLQNLQALRTESAGLEQEVRAREQDIAAAQQAERQLVRKRIKNAVRLALAIGVYLLFRACLNAIHNL